MNCYPLVRQFEEPFADSSMVVSYLVSQLASKHVKVVLNGDGGDENFAGYGRYNKQKWYDRFGRLPLLRNKLVGDLISRQPRAGKIWNKLAGDPVYRYLSWGQYFLREDKEKLYKSDYHYLFLKNSSRDYWAEKMSEARTTSMNDQMLYADISVYLPDDLLTKMDLATMAVGIEARSPLLDQELVELAAKISFDLKVKGFGKHKYILKKALEGVLPEEILTRPKVGFSMPLEAWFKSHLQKYARSILLDKKSLTGQFMDRRAVKAMLRDERDTNQDFGPKLWSLLTLELWWREYFA